MFKKKKQLEHHLEERPQCMLTVSEILLVKGKAKVVQGWKIFSRICIIELFLSSALYVGSKTKLYLYKLSSFPSCLPFYQIKFNELKKNRLRSYFCLEEVKSNLDQASIINYKHGMRYILPQEWADHAHPVGSKTGLYRQAI